MLFDLKTPCKNCPFRTDSTAIRFACRERAEEISEQAYRRGFPCHLSADLIEENGNDESGFVPGENTQHCVGFLIMMMNQGETEWPGVDNDDEFVNQLWDQVDWATAPVFDNEEDYLDANTENRG